MNGHAGELPGEIILAFADQDALTSLAGQSMDPPTTSVSSPIASIKVRCPSFFVSSLSIRRGLLPFHPRAKKSSPGRIQAFCVCRRSVRSPVLWFHPANSPS